MNSIKYILILILVSVIKIADAQVVTTYMDHAQINQPYGIAIDDDDNIYFADQANGKIFKIDFETNSLSTIIDNTDITNFIPNEIYYYEDFLYFINDTVLYKYNLDTDYLSVVYNQLTSIYNLSDYKNLAVIDDTIFLVHSYEVSTLPTIYETSIDVLSGINTAVPILNTNYSKPISSLFPHTYNDVNDIEISDEGTLLILESNSDGTGSKLFEIDFEDGTTVDLISVFTSIQIAKGLVQDDESNIYIAGSYSNKIYKYNTLNDELTHYAGTGDPAEYNSSLLESKFDGPVKLAINSNGEMFISDLDNGVIRRIGCTVAPKPIVESSVDIQNYCKNSGEIIMKVADDSELNDNEYWVWYKESCDGPALDTGKECTLKNLDQTTTYAVRSAGGCIQKGACQTFTIQVKDCNNGNNVFIKNNAFSPNNDGVNDTFVLGVLAPNTTVIFYNAWGDVLKKIDDYSTLSNGWDGTGPNNKRMAPGSYFYTIENNGEIASGWVQLLR